VDANAQAIASAGIDFLKFRFLMEFPSFSVVFGYAVWVSRGDRKSVSWFPCRRRANLYLVKKGVCSMTYTQQ
jgi:hypothetical protein